ncbi:MAG: TIGR01906 family membrane protein [Chloroflexi bacterium]|nr:TIGR01906 family membrane protein [Chloroflexota bacterium]
MTHPEGSPAEYRRLDSLAKAGITLLVPPLLLLSNLYLLISPAFMNFQYALGLPPAERFTTEERVYWAKATLEYLRPGRDVSYLAAMEDEQGAIYTQRELSHMVDVKVLVDRTFLAHAVLLVLALISAVYLWGQPLGRLGLARALSGGSSLTIALFGLLGLFVAVAFTIFFDAFHRVFFVGDTWIFRITDTLIQLFPPAFWYNAAVAWAVLTMAEAAVIWLLTRMWVRGMRVREEA